MDKEEYKKLVDIKLTLGLAESCLAEVLAEIEKANKIVRELILRKENPDA